MSAPWTDGRVLADGQDRTDANLLARQSVYPFQRPRIDLPATVLSLAALDGTETVADVGCGNGALAVAVRAIPFGPDGVFRVRTHSGCLVAT
jgi:hypothetical protein